MLFYYDTKISIKSDEYGFCFNMTFNCQLQILYSAEYIKRYLHSLFSQNFFGM